MGVRSPWSGWMSWNACCRVSEMGGNLQVAAVLAQARTPEPTVQQGEAGWEEAEEGVWSPGQNR